MVDPRLENAPIVRATMCRLGSHVFVTSAAGTVWGDWKIKREFEYLNPRCDCGAYRWLAWQEAQKQEAT